jgi:hypothetical protein
MLGELKRQHLIERFDIPEAAASRDIALYKSLSNDNLVYDESSRLYKASDCSDNFYSYVRYAELTQYLPWRHL